MQKVRFTRDYVGPNKQVDHKNRIRVVTSRHAAFLVANKFAVNVGDDDKEEKEAEKRKTK